MTFPVTLSYGIALTKSYEVKRKKFGSNYSQRTGKAANRTRRKFRLVWANVTVAEANLLENYFDNLGGVDTFDWTPQDDTVSAKWTADNFNKEYPSFNIRTVSIEAEEEFDNG